MPPDPASILPLAAAPVWQPAVGIWTLLALGIVAVLALRRAGRILRHRCGPRRGLLLTGLRATALAALGLALLDPACARDRARALRGTVVIGVDVSASMGVADAAHDKGTRLERALALARRIADGLPAGVRVLRGTADTAWRPLPHGGDWPPVAGDEGTDLAVALLQASEHPDVQDAALLVLLTDGGDGPVAPARMPAAPLVTVGVGGDPAAWRDVSIAAVAAPERVELAARLEVQVALAARTAGDAAFAARLGALRCLLERFDGSEWQPLGERTADLRGGAAQVTFEVVPATLGAERWRTRVESVEGELTALNNRREFPVLITRESLKVLYYARRLGADLKFLRQELAADPSVSFSTLVLAAGETFLLQGGVREWADFAGVAGLPPLPLLRRFDVLLLGSFPAVEWRRDEIAALRAFVDAGGGLVWIGGEHSFDAAHAALPLAELIPWHIADNAGMVRTPAAVQPTAATAGAAATAGLWEALRGGPGQPATVPELSAFRRVGAPRSGAVTLLHARTPEGLFPLLVEQPYGRGRILALASNTSWRWALAGPPLDAFYRRLWRQVVRAAAGETERTGMLRVRLDPAAPRPGERTTIDVEVLEDEARWQVTAKLAGPGGGAWVGLERLPDVAGRWRGAFVCRQRGRHTLTVTATRTDGATETWERLLDVGVTRNEGARLELESADLEQLARRGGGAYFDERTEALPDRVAALLRAAPADAAPAPRVSTSPWYLLAVAGLLCFEWLLRRRSHLI